MSSLRRWLSSSIQRDNIGITFRNTKNEVIEAVEIRTDDTIFLVKIGKRLIAAMEELEKDEKQNSKKEDEEDTTNFNEALEIPDEEIE